MPFNEVEDRLLPCWHLQTGTVAVENIVASGDKIAPSECVNSLGPPSPGGEHCQTDSPASGIALALTRRRRFGYSVMKMRMSVATAFALTLLTPAAVGLAAWLWWGLYGVFWVFATPIWLGATAAVAVLLACFVSSE